MEAFVDHFVHSLGLSTQYTMVVLNPTWTASEPMYGYRQGVSQKELEYIANAGQDQVRSLLVGRGAYGVERGQGSSSPASVWVI